MKQLVAVVFWHGRADVVLLVRKCTDELCVHVQNFHSHRTFVLLEVNLIFRNGRRLVRKKCLVVRHRAADDLDVAVLRRVDADRVRRQLVIRDGRHTRRVLVIRVYVSLVHSTKYYF